MIRGSPQHIHCIHYGFVLLICLLLAKLLYQLCVAIIRQWQRFVLLYLGQSLAGFLVSEFGVSQLLIMFLPLALVGFEFGSKF